MVKSHILTSFILEKGRDLTGSFRSTCELFLLHHQHSQIKSCSEFVTHTTNMSSKNTGTINPTWGIQCHSVHPQLMQIHCVGSSCFQQTEPKNEIQQRNLAIPPGTTAVTHTAAHHLNVLEMLTHQFVELPLGHGAESFVCRSEHREGSRPVQVLCQTCRLDCSHQRTAKQTCIKCFAANHCVGQLRAGLKRELGSYNCEILLQSSKPNNQNGD